MLGGLSPYLWKTRRRPPPPLCDTLLGDHHPPQPASTTTACPSAHERSKEDTVNQYLRNSLLEHQLEALPLELSVSK